MPGTVHCISSVSPKTGASATSDSPPVSICRARNMLDELTMVALRKYTVPSDQPTQPTRMTSCQPRPVSSDSPSAGDSTMKVPMRPTTRPMRAPLDKGVARRPKVPSHAIHSAGVAFSSAATFDGTCCRATTLHPLLMMMVQAITTARCLRSLRE